jgi:hypothetical protein
MLLELVNRRLASGFLGQKKRVAAMSRPFADAHLGRSQPLKQLDRRGQHLGLGVDHAPAFAFHQVRLQKHPFPACLKPASRRPAQQSVDQTSSIRRSSHNRHRRTPPSVSRTKWRRPMTTAAD